MSTQPCDGYAYDADNGHSCSREQGHDGPHEHVDLTGRVTARWHGSVRRDRAESAGHTPTKDSDT